MTRLDATRRPCSAYRLRRPVMMISMTAPSSFLCKELMLALWIWLAWSNGVTGWDRSNVSEASKPEVTSSSSEPSASTGGDDVFRPHLIDDSDQDEHSTVISGSGDAIAGDARLPPNCLALMECDALSDVMPPPDLLFFLPPPPLPAFLFTSLSESDVLVDGGGGRAEDGICNLCEWALGINGSGTTSAVQHAGESNVNNEAADVPGGSEGGGDGGTPSLVNHGSKTTRTSATTTTTTSSDDRATWISILVAASFGSAAIGAVLMVVLLKCRKFKILPVTDSCPILPDGYFASKSSSNSSQEVVHVSSTDDPEDSDRIRNPPNTNTSSPAVIKPPPPTQPPRASHRRSEKPHTTTGSSGWSFWRRSRGNQSSSTSTAEHPLRSSSTTMCSSENSYSEEPYVVSEHSSALYAELNSVCQQQDGVGIGAAPPFYRTYSMNTYSEVSDPSKGGGHHCHCQQHAHPHHHHHQHQQHKRLISDGAYENAAYVVSDGSEHFGHCECGASSPGLQVETDSLDTPSSSAYYSDSSNQTNGQKRRKKQEHQMMMMMMDNGDVPPPPPLPQQSSSESLAMDNMIRKDQLPPVVCYPCDYGGGARLVRYGHDRYGLVPMAHLDSGVKRPLPSPPPPPPCPSSTVRPLPPVPSQYV